MERFGEDLLAVMERIGAQQPPFVIQKLEKVWSRLLELKKRNMVKINHSVMELLTARSLILEGYDVTVEYPLGGNLVCDLHATKGSGTLILEIETGYVPPDHALDPLTYNRARVASKISRYNSYANKFTLGTPPTNILQIAHLFLKPPSLRRPEDIYPMKKLCDTYYSEPPVEFEDIRNARLHAIYIIDVDGLEVRQLDPEAYIDSVSNAPPVGRELKRRDNA